MDYSYENVKKMIEQSDRNEIIFQLKHINRRLRGIHRVASIVGAVYFVSMYMKYKDKLKEFKKGE